MENSELIQVINSPLSTGIFHYCIIDQEGKLWMFGKMVPSPLAGPTFKPGPFIPTNIPFSSKVISVSCSILFTVAVTLDGKVYVWGSELYPFSNISIIFPKNGPKRSATPFLIPEFQNKIAVKAYASLDGYGVIFKDGSATVKIRDPNYYRAVRERSPEVIISQIFRLESKIVDMALGVGKVFLLTEDGLVYTFGKPFLPEINQYVSDYTKSKIFLGLSDGDGKYNITPVLVPFYKRIKQIQISGGLLALTYDGDVFQMNSYGKNGPEAVSMLNAISPGEYPQPVRNRKVLPDLETAIRRSRPRKIEIPEVVKFIAGQEVQNSGILAAITKGGDLYMAGQNDSGNISPNMNVSHIDKPIKLDIGSKVNFVSLSDTYTIVTTEDGQVRYWGFPGYRPKAPVEPNWYGNCSNPNSLVTLSEWEEGIDYVKIYSSDSSGNLLERPTCYDRQNLVQFAKTNIFADWVPKDSFSGEIATIAISGHGGQPGNKRFYRLISGEYIDSNSYDLLKNSSIRELVMRPILKNQLIGNLRGSFGIGEHHGQSPGFTIYSLQPKD